MSTRPSNSFDQFEEFFSVGLGELKKFVRHVLQTFYSRIGIDLIGTRVLKERQRGDNGLEQWFTVHLTLPRQKPRPSGRGIVTGWLSERTPFICARLRLSPRKAGRGRREITPPRSAACHPSPIHPSSRHRA